MKKKFLKILKPYNIILLDILAFVLIIFFATAYPLSASADYLITLDSNSRTLIEHPRLLVNAADLDGLRAKTTNNPIYDVMTSDIQGYITTYWNPTTHTWADGKSCADLPWSTATDGVLGTLVSLGLYYQMYPDGVLNGVSAHEQATFAKRVLQDLANDVCGYNDNTPWTSNPNRDYGSIHLFYIGRIYDLIYNVDDDALISGDANFKNSFFTWINDVMFPMVESHEEYTSNGSNPAQLPPEANLMLTAMRGRATFALATYEDNELSDGYGDATHNSEYYLEGAWDYTEDRLIPFKNTVMQGGHGTDGGDYHMNRTAFYTLALFEVFRTAITDLNPFALLTGSWVDEQIDFDIHRSLPVPTHIYVEGTYGEYSLTDWARQFSDMVFVSGRYATDSAKRGRDFIKKVFDPYANAGEISPHYAADWFMYYDNAGEVIDYKNLPTSIFTPGSDLLISRTGWGADEIFTEFRAAQGLSAYTRGALFHSGAYTIYGGEPLIINNIADTNITSNGAPEKYNITTVTNSVLNYYGINNLGCPGGMYKYSGATDSAGIEYGSADIIRYLDGNVPVRYAKADITGSYLDISTGGGGGGKVIDLAYRSVVHSIEAGAGSYIIVNDYIDQHESGDMVSQIHYAGDPTIIGQKISWSGVSSKIETNVLVPTATIQKTDVADTVSSNMRTAVPTINVFQVDIPLGSNDKASSLVVHSPTNDLLATFPAVSLIDSNEMRGAFILDPSINRAILFSKNDNAPTGDIIFTISPNSSQMRVFVADLAQGATYYTRESSAGSDLTISIYSSDPGGGASIRSTDSSGTLSFLVNSVTDLTAPSAPINLSVL